MAPSTRNSSEPANESQNGKDAKPTAGQKRKADVSASPAGKRDKKVKQPTLEETKNGVQKIDDEEMTDANAGGEKDNETNGSLKQESVDDDNKENENVGGKNASSDPKQDSGTDVSRREETAKAGDEGKSVSTMDDSGTVTKDDQGKRSQDQQANTKAKDSDTVEINQDRLEAEPSNVLEKGIIYFFIRARVNTSEQPEDVKDIQRAYMVLRPLPEGTKLHEGPMPELENCRLIALPKKVWPKSPKDRFMCFVEKAGTTVADLKESFLAGSEYDTKTTGTSHTPPVTPVGEGVYAITTQGRDTHLAYMLTVPEQPGEVQQDIGIAEKGSFALSVKNPTASGPANASLPEGPEFPKSILDEFRGLRWMGCQPKHLEYANAQFLIIGGKSGELGHAVDAASKDQKHAEKETPEEELEKLEDEDQTRAEALQGDAIFADLGVSKKEYPKLQTTW